MENCITNEQRELVENNHNLIYEFAHKNKLDIGEYYGILAIALCNAAKAYNKNNSSFSTFAFACMQNAVSNNIKLINSANRIPYEKIFSYNNETNNDNGFEENTFINFIADNSYTDEEAINNIMLESFYDILTEKERIVLGLIIDGVSQVNIAERMGCTKQNISSCVCNIRKKATKYFNVH